MLKFDSLEELGQWAEKHRVTRLDLGESGEIRGVSFAEPLVAISPVSSTEDEDDEEALSSPMDQALGFFLNKKKGGAHA